MRAAGQLVSTLRDRLTPSGSIGERAATSGVWAALGNGLGRFLQLVKLLVLANFLSQEAFGLVGVALLLLVALRRLSNLGIREALIQRPETDVDDYLETAWLIRIGRGLLASAVVIAVAPLLATLFAGPDQQPLLTTIIRVVGIAPALRGFQNPGTVYLKKELAFHREFVLRVGTAAVDVTVAIGAVLALGSVWALVYGTLAGAVARLVLSFLVHPYRPGLAFDIDQARELFDFGKWVTLSSITTFLSTEGDDAFVGWFLGVGVLGVYQTAYRFSNAPATEITKVVSSVVFPTYAQLQAETDTLRAAYFRTVKLTMFLAFPAAVGIAVVAPSFVDAFINNERGWDLELLVLAMQALALWGLLRSFGATTGPLFRAVGRPDLETKLQLGKLAVIAVLIYPLTAAYGVLGTAGAVIAGSVLVSEPAAATLAVRTVEGRFGRLGRVLAYPAVGSACMGLCVLFLERAVTFPSALVRFGTLVVVGVLVYALTLPALTIAGYDIEALLRETLSAAVGDGTT